MKKKRDEQIEATEEPEPGTADAIGPDAAADQASGGTPSELERLRAENERLNDQLRRAMADLANFRKRMYKDLEDARTRAIEAFAAELLPILDNFHLALAAHEQQESGQALAETGSMISGLRMVRSLLEGTLERHGLSEIDAHGRSFDPNVHEAVGVDSDADAEPGRITQVLQRGYRFGDKVLRASRVLISGGSDDQEPPSDPS